MSAFVFSRVMGKSATYLPRFLPLPHPSPRNRIWLKPNYWFETKMLPELRARVVRILREADETSSHL